jgi:hypothetical protein
MLDLDHPMTEHIFRASMLIDGVMVRGQRMSVAPSAVREQLLAECLPLFAEMRKLNAEHFAMSAFIAQAIDEYEAGIRTLAGLAGGRIGKDVLDGAKRCPACGTRITRYPKYHLVLCGKCDNLFLPAKEKLCSLDGFGTDAI